MIGPTICSAAKCVANATKHTAICLLANRIHDPEMKIRVEMLMCLKDKPGRLQDDEVSRDVLHKRRSLSFHLCIAR